MMGLLTFLKHFNYIFSEKSVLPEALLAISFPRQLVVLIQYLSLSQLAVQSSTSEYIYWLWDLIMVTWLLETKQANQFLVEKQSQSIIKQSNCSKIGIQTLEKQEIVSSGYTLSNIRTIL